MVQRQRLFEHLSQSVDGKLTLISGPAGFGKTSLLSEWIAQQKRSLAWVSLDEGDNDWKRFLLYLIKAFQNISDGFANEIVEMLHSIKSPQREVVLTYLINQITEIQGSFLIVLDDYHVITDPGIHELMIWTLENQPSQMHLIISTRSDPPWPLARWRVKGELSEIRSRDLRFTLDETATLLNDILHMDLPMEHITQLSTQTEGWVAGLRMAALSIQTRDDTTNFIQRFTGNHRYIFDYLLDEVFERLPQEIQDFLLRTSILDRMCASLCDFVRNRNDSQLILDHLEQMNLFLIPLDDQRSWYRYHHLFSELLRQTLKQTYPEEKPRLHQRALEWYQCNELFGEAIHHGIEKGDMEQVADLIENNIYEVLEHRDLISLARWVESLPAEIVKRRPWLNIAYARLLLETGSQENAAEHIHIAEISLEKEPGLRTQEEHIRSYIASIQADLSVLSGDMESAIAYAHQALQLLPKNDKLLHCLVASTLGTSLQRCGSFEDAAQAFTDGIKAGKVIGDSNAVISLYGDLIGLYVESGQLYQAHTSCQEALQFIESSYQKRGRYSPGAAHIHFRLSTILRHWNDLEGSLHHAQISNTILEKWGLRYRLNFINMAIALHASGDYSGAHRVLGEAEQVASQLSAFWLENVKATRTSFWLTEGNLEAASQWVVDGNLDSNDEISFQNQLLYRTLANVRLAQGCRGDVAALDEALYLSSRLQTMMESSRATAYLIQTMILQALAFQAKGEPDQATKSLSKALVLGEQGGYIRVFVREGEPMAKLLQAAASQGVLPSYTGKLLRVFESTQKGQESEETGIQPLPEPLTKRELDVLRCMGSNLTIPEIADSLVISIETVRTHIKRIYRKLDVHSRFEAITRAKDLGLLG
jgi:LuxR family maltose regulon positive regulatory protein